MPSRKADPAANEEEARLFAPILAAFANEPRVEVPQPRGGGLAHRFGADELKVDGKIFAMMSKGRLVLKLPEARVAELVAAERGEPFQLGTRVMKQWIAFSPAETNEAWPALAQEAFAFVGAPSPTA